MDSVDIVEGNGCVILTYRARYFLWNMVRRTAAAIAEVASGHSSLADVAGALEGDECNFGIARADALTLTEVGYDGLEFIPCDSHVLSGKVDEQTFSARLRLGFYSSIMHSDG